MKKIHLKDKCDGDNCEVYFFNYDGEIHKCPNCGATFCDECFQAIKNNRNICPKCLCGTATNE